jgi:hypothetical protein
MAPIQILTRLVRTLAGNLPLELAFFPDPRLVHRSLGAERGDVLIFSEPLSQCACITRG